MFLPTRNKVSVDDNTYVQSGVTISTVIFQKGRLYLWQPSDCVHLFVINVINCVVLFPEIKYDDDGLVSQ